MAKTLDVTKSTVWNILEKKERTGELSNTKRPGRPRKTTVVDDRIIISLVKKNPFTTVWPDQEHSPGGRCMCIKVNNQEKTSPEWIQRVRHKMSTIGEPQKQEDQIRVCQTTSKKAFTVLEQHPMDRWDKNQPEWWEEKSMEKERNCSWSKHTTSSVKQDGGSVMAWACMAANGTGSLVFVDDVTADKSSKMNSEV